MAGVPFSSPVVTELHELVRLQALAASITPKKSRVASKRHGSAPSKQFGRGLDFAEVRAYHAGDEVRMMDWNVTARTGRAHIKVFTEERERPVVFLVDQTSSMHFGTKGMYKSAMAVRLAALLAWCAIASGDRVGGVVAFPGRVNQIKPAGQKQGLLRLLKTLINSYDSQDNERALDDSSCLQQALQRVRALAPSGSRLVLLSDFNHVNEAIEQELKGLLKRLEVTPICIQDAIELTLPKQGLLPVKSRGVPRGTSPFSALLDTGDAARRAHALQARAHQERLNSLFIAGGQGVTYVQGHHSLTDSARRAWFGVRAPSDSAAQSHG